MISAQTLLSGKAREPEIELIDMASDSIYNDTPIKTMDTEA